ncbi:MAG: GntR family transcriptional regulator [Rhodobacterales bacterium]|nr:GntR family transcriptional regulator [Rhodobacterales bacterium]
MGRPSDTKAEQELYREIRRAVGERRLLPGTKLTEESLAELFGVSRARVRKVLLLLSKDKIVQLVANRGAYVWKPTVEEARNVLSARKLVETHLVSEAASRATSRQIAQLRAIAAQEAEAKLGNDTARMMRLSGDFHMKLAECASNPILEEFLATLMSRSYLILAAYQVHNSHNCPQDDHTRIADRIEARDSAGAVQELEVHFGHIEAELNLRGDEPEEKTNLGKILRRN